MTLILKNHFALNKGAYLAGVQSGKYNNAWRGGLRLQHVKPTVEALRLLQAQLSEKWHWDAQGRYHDGTLEDKLNHPETSLFLLKDKGMPVGYALVTVPDAGLRARFWQSANHSVVEVENLGLFPGQEGGGRGRAYFEMLFAKYFKDYDTVYWSQHETHSPTLKRFYQEKMGMELLATDSVRDFRPKFG